MGKSEKGDEILAFLRAVDSVLSADEGAAVGLIKQYNLVREHLPTQLLNSKPVSSYMRLISTSFYVS